MSVFTKTRFWLVSVIVLVTVLAVACGEAAAPTQQQPAAVQATSTPPPQSVATVAPTATPLPSGVMSAKDKITLVLPEEPIGINSLGTIGASLNAAVTRANLQDPLTWQSGDDQRIVPTSASTGWES